MTRITNADQVLMLLRSYLQRTEGVRRSRKTEKTGQNGAAPTALQRVQTIATTADLPEEELERVLISGLFTEEFGSAIASDSKFQTMVDDVLRMIHSDPAGRRVLRQAVGQLRVEPR
jgi:hypothetical protein